MSYRPVLYPVIFSRLGQARPDQDSRDMSVTWVPVIEVEVSLFVKIDRSISSGLGGPFSRWYSQDQKQHMIAARKATLIFSSLLDHERNK